MCIRPVPQQWLIAVAARPAAVVAVEAMPLASFPLFDTRVLVLPSGKQLWVDREMKFLGGVLWPI